MPMKLMSTHRQNKEGTKFTKKPILQLPCTDMVKPKQFKMAVQNIPTSAIFLKSAIWRPGQQGKISITFGDQMCSGCDPSAAWSQIGSNSTGEFPSMNLGFMDPPWEDFSFNGKTHKFEEFQNAMRNYCDSSDPSSCWEGWVPGCTVIHEFGHALGMMHEHQNNLFNSNSINLDQNAVVKYYENIGMSKAEATVNVLDRYECNDQECDYAGSKYDKKSIMLYYLPDDWVIGENPTYPNFVLSELDKQWLGSNYPVEGHSEYGMPEITIEFVDDGAPAWKEAWVQKMVVEDLAPIIGIRFRFIGSDGTIVTTKPIETVPPSLALKDDNVSLAKERIRQNKKLKKQKKRSRSRRADQKHGSDALDESTFEEDTQDVSGTLTFAPVEILDVTNMITEAPVYDFGFEDLEFELDEDDLEFEEDSDLGFEEELDMNDPENVPLKLLCSIEKFGNSNKTDYDGTEIFGIAVGAVVCLLFVFFLFKIFFPDTMESISKTSFRGNFSSYYLRD
jgi:hypothetical protein